MRERKRTLKILSPFCCSCWKWLIWLYYSHFAVLKRYEKPKKVTSLKIPQSNYKQFNCSLICNDRHFLQFINLSSFRQALYFKLDQMNLLPMENILWNWDILFCMNKWTTNVNWNSTIKWSTIPECIELQKRKKKKKYQNHKVLSKATSNVQNHRFMSIDRINR